MKKIIKNKLYDTDTAKQIAFATGGGQGPRDFRYYEETLYRKKTGEYFLFGEGGPLTHYCEWLDSNNRRGGSKIVPMSYKAAREWAEEHMDADDYMAEFGPVAEDDSVVQMGVNIPASVAETIRRISRETGKPIGEVIAEKFA